MVVVVGVIVVVVIIVFVVLVTLVVVVAVTCWSTLLEKPTEALSIKKFPTI